MLKGELNSMQSPRSPKNVLVTGGLGFIGSAFIRSFLKSSDANVINLDALTYAANPAALAAVEEDLRYTFIKGNITDADLLAYILDKHQIDAIVHFAAESHVDRSIAGPKAFIESNIIGTFQLLEAVRARPGIHFHHVSTDEVYGSTCDTFTEESPYHPNSPYSASKAASDHLVRAYQKTYGLLACISHSGNNYGPYQHSEKLIPLMTLHAMQGKPLPVYGNGRNVRDWIHVEDHVNAIVLLLHNGRQGECYNISGGAELDNLTIVRKICSHVAHIGKKDFAELESLITFVQDRPGHDFRYSLDSTKIRDELGFTPKYTFDSGLKNTIAWYLQLGLKKFPPSATVPIG